MTLSFTAEVRDSLSNLAASLNAGRDKTLGDAFFLFDLDRSQAEAMYRGDWLARKIIDIVPYDMVREWRVWSGAPADVAAAEAVERRFTLRKLVQRALTLGRLYGGAALIIGTEEEDPADLAQELYPEFIRPGGVKFLHVVSRWQLSTPTVDRDPLSRWFGEPDWYEVTAPTRGALRLHPSRVIRFLGNELPDPSIGVSVWSDSILQTLYDAIHAVALTTTGATSLMHEAKVDVVTVPNLSEHLSSSATTAQLSARFSYAAAMKSLNNLLLLGDGETWSRQKIDFAGLPEMVRTFLQVAAGAADIPVTRLLGQSPAGMSATGESDTRNYYDMIAARQAIDLRPKFERLDQLILRSAGVDPAALTFEFRPLWQMDAAASATIALQKAQATQIYAGLDLWPASVTARLVEAQLAEDGTYPGAEGIFAEAPPVRSGTSDAFPASSGSPAYLTEPREPNGRWTTGEGGGFQAPDDRPILISDPDETKRELEEGLAGGPGPLDDPLPPAGDDPIVQLIPRAASHGPLERVQSPASALSVLPRTPVATAKPIAPVSSTGRPSLSEPLGEAPGLPGPLRTLESIEVPPGLTLKARGETIKQRADDYAEEARKALNFDPAPSTSKKGGNQPDGLGEGPVAGLKMALEVKYLSSSEKKLRDPKRDIPFINQIDLEQARRYIDEFKGGVLWLTNDRELSDKYERLFNSNGLSGVRVVYIRSTEE